MTVKSYISSAGKRWEVFYYVKDYSGKTLHRHKRGFEYKRDAEAYAIEDMNKAHGDPLMTIRSLSELYLRYCEPRLRESTMDNKRNIIDTKILPYLGNRTVEDLREADIILWQNDIAKLGFKPTYLRSVNNQLSAMLNWGRRIYHLPNVAENVPKIGKANANLKNYYTEEEYYNFLPGVMNKPTSVIIFEVLYWTGIRLGELLALTMADVDLEKKVLRVDKSYRRKKSEDNLGDPKTDAGYRVISLPQKLVDELSEYISHIYGPRRDDRLFHVTKSYVEHEMERGIKKTGSKKIRVHDLRHSHASVLINSGEDPLMIQQRLGHEKVATTLQVYSHLFPPRDMQVANKLDEIMKGNMLCGTVNTNTEP